MAKDQNLLQRHNALQFASRSAPKLKASVEPTKMKYCSAYVASSNARCKKRAMPGSRYCVLHQSWGLNIIAAIVMLVLGAILGVIAENAYRSFVPSPESKELAKVQKKLAEKEKQPVFSFYLNGTIFTNGSSIATSAKKETLSLKFAIKNTGKASGHNVQTHLWLSQRLGNLKLDNRWKKEDYVVGDDTCFRVSEDSQHYAHIVSEPINPGTLMQLGELIITNSLSGIASVELKFGTTCDGGYSTSTLFNIALER